MSIKARKLASGKTVWDMQVAVEVRDARGRRKKITRTVATKQEALRLEARLKVEAEGGGARDSRRRVRDLMDAWLEAGTWSPTTAYGYRLLVEREIRPVLGGVRLDRLSAKHLDWRPPGATSTPRSSWRRPGRPASTARRCGPTPRLACALSCWPE